MTEITPRFVMTLVEVTPMPVPAVNGKSATVFVEVTDIPVPDVSGRRLIVFVEVTLMPVPAVNGIRLKTFPEESESPVEAVYPGEYPATEPVAEFTENAPEPEIEPTPVTAPFAVLNEVTPVFVMTLVELTPIPVPGVRGSREIVLPETPIPVPAVSEVIQVEHV